MATRPRRQPGRSDLDRDPAAAERPVGGGGRHLPQHPRGRARLSRRGALLGSARPSGGAERAGSRADREESRARARSGGLAQQSGDRPAGSPRAGRGDRRLSARDCARSESRQRAQQSRRPPEGARPSWSKRKRPIEPPFACSPDHSDAYTNLGILLNGQKRTQRSGRLLLQGHHVQAEAPRSPATAGAGALHPRRGGRGGAASSRNGSRRSRTIPLPGT